MKGRYFILWIGLCALAEFLGIAAAAIWYGGVNVLFGEPTPLLARVCVWLFMSLAAVPEGMILGGLQVMGVRWFIPAVLWRRWMTATIGVGLLAWGMGTFVPMFLVADGTAQSGSEPGLGATMLYAAIFGLVVGIVFGLAQSWALPSGIRARSIWVIANPVGWGAGLLMIYAAAQIAADRPDWISRLVIWAGGGLAAGVCVGVATGVGLVLMAGRENSRAARFWVEHSRLRD